MLISTDLTAWQMKRVALFCVLAACSASAGAAWAEPFRLGVLLDFDDPFDAQRFEAIKAAAEDYNSDLALEQYDMSHGSALEALRAAHAGGEGPSVYLGPTYSGDVESILEYVEENSLVIISPSSSATSLALPGDGVFRLTPSVHLEAGVLAGLISESGAGSAVIAVQRGPFGASVLDDMRAALAERGVTAEAAAEFEPDGSDWNAALDDLEAALGDVPDAAVLMISGFESETESMLRAASERDALASASWFVPSGALYPDSGMPASAIDVTTLVVEIDGPSSALVDDLMTSAGAEPSVYDYSAYDSVFVAGAAAKMAGGGDVRATVPAAALSVSRALGDASLDAAGDLRSATYSIWTAKAGEWSFVDRVSSPDTFCSNVPDLEGRCVEIGALISLLPVLGDDAKLAAMRAAADAHNREQVEMGQGAVYVDVVQYRFEPGAAGLSVMQGSASDVFLFAGPTTSPDLEAALSNGDAVFASPSSSASHLSLDDGAFRLTPTTARESALIAQLVADKAGSAVTVWQDDGFGRALLADVESALDAAGVEAVRGPGFDPLDPGWDRVMDDLAGSIGDAEAVLFVGGFDSEFWPAATAAAERERLLLAPWFVTPSVLDPESADLDGNNLEFAREVSLTTAALHAEPNEITRMIDVLLAGHGGASVYDYASYDAMRLLAASASVADPGDLADDVRNAFAAHADEYVGALGDISLDVAGDLDEPITYMVWTASESGWSEAGAEKADAAATDTAVTDPVVTDTAVIETADTGSQEQDPRGGGCIVATAAYGSELAPQVQRLREAREALATTEAGSALLHAFNTAYYSVAPAVADAQRQSPEFNGVVRAAIAPALAGLEALYSGGAVAN